MIIRTLPRLTRHLFIQRRLASSLVLLEHKGGKLNESSLTAITAAKVLNGDTAGIVVGSSSDVEAVTGQAKTIEGLSKIYTASSDAYSNSLAENVAPLLAAVLPAKNITHLFAAHTAVGKNVFPRLAGLLDTSMIADIIALEPSGDTFTRPIYAGNAILKVKSSPKDKIKIVTVRTTAFDKASIGNGSATVESVDTVSSDSTTKFISEELTQSSRPDLSSASRVVSGGRALKSQESFTQIIEPLADALGAAVGASRAAVDSGYADNSLQVGQTGKVVAPELYVAVGISGAIQHLAGMKESKLIVAINKDPDAPIFQVADAGLVADLFEAVPQLTKKVQENKA
ncbi:hypothetical protein TREMEDRAFT_71892 [Tremella mesenterica DSM 1558]|uniref:uncharacterized protein n=1 Tax=Tremella mesenterica (strain ATCC 24925 / CBS 8224 / DSM 1558 / NBRC 9311 / NRRL Y-6157 / RJB 2259-6 / UBC 559-6) TaxID=578456 RepID=UPI0003F49716|nr:uncharacterized protein TREMEDRAFT_71892 [Tremella mesenterica DSM 1558]EIW68707.1 hypothetical protein TREMEDRAFT_71892 [Tremella mesenterica DSM 1558]